MTQLKKTFSGKLFDENSARVWIYKKTIKKNVKKNEKNRNFFVIFLVSLIQNKYLQVHLGIQ